MLTLTILSLDLFGCLSGFWVQTVPVASRNHAIVDRHIGDVTVPKGVSAGCVSSLLHIPWLSPFIWGKITQNPQSRYSKGAQLNSSARFVTSTWPPQNGGLDWLVDPGRSWLARQRPEFTLDQRKFLPRYRKKRSSSHQLTLSPNSRLGLLCVRQRMELPNPHEYAFCQRFRVNQ